LLLLLAFKLLFENKENSFVLEAIFCFTPNKEFELFALLLFPNKELLLFVLLFPNLGVLFP
jgi:hypothetical protein